MVQKVKNTVRMIFFFFFWVISGIFHGSNCTKRNNILYNVKWLFFDDIYFVCVRVYVCVYACDCVCVWAYECGSCSVIQSTERQLWHWYHYYKCKTNVCLDVVGIPFFFFCLSNNLPLIHFKLLIQLTWILSGTVSFLSASFFFRAAVRSRLLLLA